MHDTDVKNYFLLWDRAKINNMTVKVDQVMYKIKYISIVPLILQYSTPLMRPHILHKNMAFQEGCINGLCSGVEINAFLFRFNVKWPFQIGWSLGRVASQKGFHCIIINLDEFCVCMYVCMYMYIYIYIFLYFYPKVIKIMKNHSFKSLYTIYAW